MANPRAFISFDFDNNEGSRKYFVGQSINSRVPFNIEDWSSKATLVQSQWEAIIEDKIKRCHMVIVLVGRSMGSATGVAKEITFAKTHNIPVFGVYVDNANTTSVLPTGLPRYKTIDWTWDGIASSVQQAMKEGKNSY